MSFNTQVAKESSPNNKRRSIEELKIQYESSYIYQTPKMPSKPKSPKKLMKSKVKQMASMFNSKISQIIKRDNEVGKYSTLIEELSPEPKPQTTAVFVKPIPKPRTRFTKRKAPVPTPRMKSLAKVEIKQSACIVDEDVFAKMSVKAKAQLFTQLVEDMIQKETQKPNGHQFNQKPQEEIVVEQHHNKETVEDQTNQSEIDEEKQKSAIDKLVEEAIAKLEAIEAEQVAEVAKTMPCEKTSCVYPTHLTTDKPFADEESESGLSSLPKTSSEESHTEDFATKTESSENDYEFVKPIKPLRKKKLRKNNTIKKENNQLISTDSETDSKQCEINSKSYPTSIQIISTDPVLEASFVELDQSLIRVVNSPRKIKSAYTLTVNDLETPLNTPRSSLNFAKRNQTCQIHTNMSLIDQGFETATNEADSPHKSEFSYNSSPLSSTKNNFGFSTPIKHQEHNSFANNSSAKQQLFSPISKPLKNRRKSIYEVESRRNSLAMQVIQEDQPYEPQDTFKAGTFHQTQQKLLANASALQVAKDVPKCAGEKSSQFWIKCGDFSLSLEIHFTDSERLRLLYEIFSQTSCDTKDLHFGIDDQKFSVHDPCNINNVSTKIPVSKGCSHYWFSTGDLAIPFNGKFLTSHKIQRLFRVIKETVEETGVLRFGVDEVEFSNVPEFWYEPAKFSVESQYSMLVGLQTGDSNGLEGRSKYAWPHSKPVMISDLDESINESDNFEEIESGRLSFSPFGSNYSDLASLDQEELSTPRNSQVMMSLESYCGNYESEPLDRLFEDSFVQNCQRKHPISEMLNTMQNEQQRLSSVKEHLSNYSKASGMAKDSLDALKGTPEYLHKLKSIVNEIGNINFKECSLEELQNYMYFLSRYAEICLSNCGQHMDTVRNALADYRAVVV